MYARCTADGQDRLRRPVMIGHGQLQRRRAEQSVTTAFGNSSSVY
jgi:hypothetical protein